MSTREMIAANDISKENLQELSKDQYRLWQILGVWLAAGAPMWLLGWVAYPNLSAGLPPADAGLLRVKLLTIGLVWQFVLAMIILYREEGNIGLSTISRRFWLIHPLSPATGQTQKALWWWTIPLVLLTAVIGLVLRPPLVAVWTAIFPFFAEPKGYDGAALFAPEMHARMVGAWDVLGLFFVMGLFNTVLGEEFVFRGVLLPKMKGVFGRFDWVANGVIFGFYHFHQPWGILASVTSGMLFAFCGKRFRSNWFPIIMHSGQTVLVLVLILGLVLGLA